MRIDCQLLLFVILFNLPGHSRANNRQKRYLVFTEATQWGVFATVSVPLHPVSTTSVAWFFEANYYTIDNSTYYQPLLGDVPWGRKDKRSAGAGNDVLTRKLLYAFIETMLIKHQYPGRACLLRAICDAATSHFTHNGVVGDLLHLALTPSTSLEEPELEDCFYEAEYRGLEHDCTKYIHGCPSNPLDYISVQLEYV